MAKRIRAGLILAGITVCLAVSLGGCSTADGMAFRRLQRAVDNENKAVRDSTVILAGSTSMEKLANMAAEGCMAQYPDMTVTVEFTGSSAGVEAVLAGRADIGNSSRSLKEEEKAAGAVENMVAADGIAVITDPGNKVTSLTAGQLADIYTGKIRNWKEVGGTDTAVVVAGREAGSGTRSTFEELLGIRDKCRYANELDSVGAMAARVASTPGAVGYVSFAVLDDTVNALAIDGVEATEENVRTGDYRLWQPFIMVTYGEIGRQSEAVQRFFGYLQSEEGRRLIEKAGLIVPNLQHACSRQGYAGAALACCQRE